MIPQEIYASTASSSSEKFSYNHPLNHMPVDDGSMRARLAYDLMAFMKRDDCAYYTDPTKDGTYDPHQSDNEIDILIVDGYYKEASLMVEEILKTNPQDDKALFQQAFLQHLHQEYEHLLEREEKLLAIDPKNVNALINKSFALANLDREEEALLTTNKVLAIDPDNVMALGNKAYLAKILYKDELRETTLKQAYNVSSKNRMRELQHLESKLLEDFEAVFMGIETPSAFEEFNRKSGHSDMVH
ncbi:MAG: hypothetical protein OEY94_06120 [Alphaproteobacteria bacterium]|nr:hypothetical protein [Alphaproteobacteria bacterium]